MNKTIRYGEDWLDVEYEMIEPSLEGGREIQVEDITTANADLQTKINNSFWVYAEEVSELIYEGE